MPITLTETSIVNGALSLVGQEEITDLDTDDSEEGKVCRLWYKPTRQQVFAKHPWKCLQNTVLLSADITSSNPRFGTSFTVPADFISITESDLDEERTYYFLEGDHIVVESRGAVPTMHLSYTSQEENVGRYSPWLVEYLQHELAAKMCYRLTKDRLLTREITALAEAQFYDAANRDGAQERNFIYQIDELSVVRNTRA